MYDTLTPEELGQQYVSLLDLTVDDPDGSGANGEEVVGGKLMWTTEDYNTRVRKRSGILPMSHESVYGGKFGESSDWYIIPIEGFLVIKIK